MKWWPFVTKKEYEGVIGIYKLVIELEQERHIKELQTQREEKFAQNRKIIAECTAKKIELQSQLDPLLKELSSFAIQRNETNEWSITMSLQPDLVMKLRDPALVSTFNLKSVILKRLAGLVENELEKGLSKKVG